MIISLLVVYGCGRLMRPFDMKPFNQLQLSVMFMLLCGMQMQSCHVPYFVPAFVLEEIENVSHKEQS